jgi:hypothetical protein
MLHAHGAAALQALQGGVVDLEVKAGNSSSGV